MVFSSCVSVCYCVFINAVDFFLQVSFEKQILNLSGLLLVKDRLKRQNFCYVSPSSLWSVQPVSVTGNHNVENLVLNPCLLSFLHPDRIFEDRIVIHLRIDFTIPQFI